ncbi:hypothetical protein [Streptomyces sp. NPDC059215]|uniref:hypothetical protein n=1 Tax=Streptomyces sp. NPDC059215 TaxID=3346772 RepID=UPI0036792CF1
MTDSTFSTDPRDEADSPSQAGTESSGVAKARALADSRIEKAYSARKSGRARDSWIGFPVIILCGPPGVYILNIRLISGQDGYNRTNLPTAPWGWGLGLLILAVVAAAVMGIRSANRTAALREVIRTEEFNVRAAELDYATEADAPLTANRELLQEYHRLSTNQAKSAFQLAQWVMGTAALLVSAGAVAVGLAPTTSTGITLASLTAFVTALSGYISSTLLATYRVSVEQARFYFREPLTGGYLLAAENLAKSIPETDGTSALGRVVDGFIQAATSVNASSQESTPQEDAPQDTAAAS